MGKQFHFDPDRYLELMTVEVPAYRYLQDVLADATIGVAAGRVLDLGTGTGETARAVLARHPDAELVGIDESDAMLAAARESLPHADLRRARIEDELPAGPFDLVVSALAVHHVDDVAKAGLFARVAQVVRPGGRFALADVVVPADPRDAITPLDPVHDRPSPLAALVDWLRDAGLSVEVVWHEHDLAVLTAERPS